MNLVERLEAIRQLHSFDENADCIGCGSDTEFGPVDWPCDTARIAYTEQELHDFAEAVILRAKWIRDDLERRRLVSRRSGPSILDLIPNLWSHLETQAVPLIRFPPRTDAATVPSS